MIMVTKNLLEERWGLFQENRNHRFLARFRNFREKIDISKNKIPEGKRADWSKVVRVEGYEEEEESKGTLLVGVRAGSLCLPRPGWARHGPWRSTKTRSHPRRAPTRFALLLCRYASTTAAKTVAAHRHAWTVVMDLDKQVYKELILCNIVNNGQCSLLD